MDQVDLHNLCQQHFARKCQSSSGKKRQSLQCPTGDESQSARRCLSIFFWRATYTRVDDDWPPIVGCVSGRLPDDSQYDSKVIAWILPVHWQLPLRLVLVAFGGMRDVVNLHQVWRIAGLLLQSIGTTEACDSVGSSVRLRSVYQYNTRSQPGLHCTFSHVQFVLLPGDVQACAAASVYNHDAKKSASIMLTIVTSRG